MVEMEQFRGYLKSRYLLQDVSKSRKGFFLVSSIRLQEEFGLFSGSSTYSLVFPQLEIHIFAQVDFFT